MQLSSNVGFGGSKKYWPRIAVRCNSGCASETAIRSSCAIDSCFWRWRICSFSALKIMLKMIRWYHMPTVPLCSVCS
ncbi:unnamed protein product [Gongylonema pulchrum]|uniref:Uncharacterized protein n=1 Tax=Gongylonema pulchrum TaxID=637853 RepID=A0A183D9P9_9BILA|nr:unnamed protein product [Gongylonema pulchrum]